MSNREKRISLVGQLAWHWMMGMTLGILCGGFLLVANTPELHHLIGRLGSSLARLEFLISVGISFGASATLTGVMFLLQEKS